MCVVEGFECVKVAVEASKGIGVGCPHSLPTLVVCELLYPTSRDLGSKLMHKKLTAFVTP